MWKQQTKKVISPTTSTHLFAYCFVEHPNESRYGWQFPIMRKESKHTNRDLFAIVFRVNYHVVDIELGAGLLLWRLCRITEHLITYSHARQKFHFSQLCSLLHFMLFTLFVYILFHTCCGVIVSSEQTHNYLPDIDAANSSRFMGLWFNCFPTSMERWIYKSKNRIIELDWIVAFFNIISN